MPPVRPIRATLEERIDQLHSEIEALIQDRLALEKAQCPSVPVQQLRQMFDAKNGVCACRVAKRMNDEDRKSADPEAFEAEQERKRQEYLRETIGQCPPPAAIEEKIVRLPAAKLKD